MFTGIWRFAAVIYTDTMGKKERWPTFHANDLTHGFYMAKHVFASDFGLHCKLLYIVGRMSDVYVRGPLDERNTLIIKLSAIVASLLLMKKKHSTLCLSLPPPFLCLSFWLSIDEGDRRFGSNIGITFEIWLIVTWFRSQIVPQCVCVCVWKSKLTRSQSNQ